ncbi:MAG: hypothetical protein LAKADJCE_00568 [Candidatus Argoarchaeum ethanivorans]|uniref:Uncharacterized protein n=1 Tax=Candidatus Argoarchaeum ethanivorans TaxID=2608793 RepID=A0A811TBK2_9EURY|nr:MAG: hypothetical protein LAKADJCE_00568 [Candidatus Argoarchaeum ethanivorans]
MKVKADEMELLSKMLVEIRGLRKDLKSDIGDINDDYWQ